MKEEELNEDYIYQLFKLALKNGNYLTSLQQYLKLQYIPGEELRKIWQAILTEYSLSENAAPPSIPTLKIQFRRDIQILERLSRIKNADIDNEESIIGTFTEWIRQNIFAEVFEKAEKLYNRGDTLKAYQVFNEGNLQLQSVNLGIAVFERVFQDFNKRAMGRTVEAQLGTGRIRIPFGIDELDHYTKGAETGESVLIVGRSGTGKSFFGCHLGINAARRGYDVAHFQAEGTKKQCLDRYDSCWTGAQYFDIKEGLLTEAQQARIQKALFKVGRGEVHVDVFEKFGAKTILYVRSKVKDLKTLHPNLRYVILDYMDLVDPDDSPTTSAMERFRQLAVARAIKDIAVEMDVIFVTFTQASSVLEEIWNDPGFVLTTDKLAEAKSKSQPFDLVITINITRDEKRAKKCRLWIEKAREHAGASTIPIFQRLDISRFYDRKRTIAELYDEKIRSEAGDLSIPNAEELERQHVLQYSNRRMKNSKEFDD